MERELKIDSEFYGLIPTLAEDEKEQLRNSIKEDGVRDALVVWGEIIIDGHNRYEIAQELGVGYKTKNKDFADRSHAKEWIILNQFGRRNISVYQRAALVLKLQDEIASRAKERQKVSQGPGKKGLPYAANLIQHSKNPVIHTREELAKIAGVAQDTIWKVKQIEASADKETKEMLNKGDISIRAAYQKVTGKKPSKKPSPTTQRSQKHCYLTGKRLTFLRGKIEYVIQLLDVKSNSLAPVSVIRNEVLTIKKELDTLEPYRK